MDNIPSFYNASDFKLTQTKLGEGDYGTMYVAENSKDNGKYAVKIISTLGQLSGQEQILLMKESIIHSKLENPSLVKFYGVNFQSLNDSSKFEPSILIEYLPNGSIKSILGKNKMNSTQKSILLLGITYAMKFLHQNDICHLSLKPDNVLIDENNFPKLSDFGYYRIFPLKFSEVLSKISKTNSIEDIVYIAPELLGNKENYGKSSDVYSFAILAYQIVTGKKPFLKKKEKISAESLIEKVTSGDRPKFKKYKNSKMKELISLCWSQNPDERPTFDEIYEKLSSDFEYFEEDANKDEINGYIEKVCSKNKNKKDLLCFTDFDDGQKSIQSYIEITKEFIQSSGNVYDTFINMKPIFYYACESGNLHLVKYIISLNQIDLNVRYVFTFCLLLKFLIQ